MIIYELRFKVNIGFEDILEAIVESGRLNFLGYNIDYPTKNNEDFLFFNIYNENKEILENNLNIIKEIIQDIEYSFTINELNSEEYLTSYMKFLKPFNIGNVTIVPNLKETFNENNDNTIYIAKQYAFGTGTHHTTSLALEMINDYYNNIAKGNIEEKTIADIGCGSGILSLFSAKLGCNNITSVDIDSDAINCTKDNANYNNIKLSNIILGSANNLKENKYDLVIANIETDVLIIIIKDLINILKDSSILILSGILLEKEENMLNSIKENNLKIIERKSTDEWVSLMLQL